MFLSITLSHTFSYESSSISGRGLYTVVDVLLLATKYCLYLTLCSGKLVEGDTRRDFLAFFLSPLFLLGLHLYTAACQHRHWRHVFYLWDTFYVSPILLPQYTPFCLFHQRSCPKLQAISAWHFSAIATVWCLILWSVDFYTGHCGTGILGIMLIYLEHRFGL